MDIFNLLPWYNQILCKSSQVSQHSNHLSNATRIQYYYRDSNISFKDLVIYLQHKLSLEVKDKIITSLESN